MLWLRRFAASVKCVLDFLEKKEYMLAAGCADNTPHAACVFKKQYNGVIKINSRCPVRHCCAHD
jgi:hypothetical protein